MTNQSPQNGNTANSRNDVNVKYTSENGQYPTQYSENKFK